MAANDSLGAWLALSAHPPSANFATLGLRNNHVILNFDDSTSESSTFAGVVPNTYSELAGQKVVISWAAASATSGNVRWSVQIERQQAGGGFDLDADDFSSSVSQDGSAAPTSGQLAQTTIDLTSLGVAELPHVGEAFRLKVTRDAAHVNDTLVGDVELLAVELREA